MEQAGEAARDDVQYQILEHLRALRTETRALATRIAQIEQALAALQVQVDREPS